MKGVWRPVGKLLLGVGALWALLLALEWSAFARQRRVPAWSWPVAPAPAPANAAKGAFLLLDGNRSLALTPPDLARLQKALARAGILHVAAAVSAGSGASTIERALGLAGKTRDCFVALALGAEDLARDALAGSGAVPRPHLVRHGADIEVVPAPKASPATGSWLDYVPVVRFLGRDDVTVIGEGILPHAMWPYARSLAKETARYRQTRLALTLLRDDLKPRNSRLVVVWVPTPLEIVPATLSACLADLGLDTESIESRRPARRVRDLCTELGLVFVDATGPLIKSMQKKRRVFVAGDPPPLAGVLSERGRTRVITALVAGVQRLLTR